MAGEAADTCARYPPISAYALVGDCRTAALVSREGSIDWYCPGRFDAPAVFCRLLDVGKGGYLSLQPAGIYAASREYRGATNVLETTFTTAGGAVRVTDLMPVGPRSGAPRAPAILRLVEGLAGEMTLDVRFKPTFDFARARTELALAPGGVVARAGDDSLTLSSPDVVYQLAGDEGARGRLHLAAGDRRWLTLTSAAGPDPARSALTPADCDAALVQTLAYWQQWAADFSYRGPHRAEVLRSALALKLLSYSPTGAVVAAPTSSLPEVIGGARNWDYRYTWLRDSSLILYALLTTGCDEEATTFFRWLTRVQGASPSASPQIVYTIDGGRDLPEVALDNLEGYRCSRPVRIGNAAASQFQLDVYGEVLIAAYLHFQARPGDGSGEAARGSGPSPETWATLRGLVEQAAKRWQEPDRGIWEVRGGPQQFLYSRLMCWAALDRGIRLAREYGLEAPVDAWSRTRAAIRRAILTRGYDAQVGAFTQAFGNSALDASALAIPIVGFLPATDPRFQSTVERIRAELTRDGLVYRYRTQDSLPGTEGTFTLCSFWLVDALALGGKLGEARRLFEGLLAHASDVGLLSEELAPGTGEFLGNFPQGCSHLGLIISAINLAVAERHGPEERPVNEAQRARKARPTVAGATRAHEQR